MLQCPCTNTCMHACTHTHTHIHCNTHKHNVHMHICVHTHTYVCTHTCRYAHISPKSPNQHISLVRQTERKNALVVSQSCSSTAGLLSTNSTKLLQLPWKPDITLDCHVGNIPNNRRFGGKILLFNFIALTVPV